MRLQLFRPQDRRPRFTRFNPVARGRIDAQGSAFSTDLSWDPVSGIAGRRPAFDLDANAGPELIDRVSGQNLTTFTRAASANWFDGDGVLLTAGPNTMRRQWYPLVQRWGWLIEEARTNSLRNNSLAGGVAGDPGTMPTHWNRGTPAGLNHQILAISTVNGMPCMDIRVHGTTTAAISAANIARPDGNTTAAALSGQVWTASWFVALLAGSTAGLTVMEMCVEEFGSGGTYLAGSYFDLRSTINSTLTRRTVSRTLNQATTAFTMTRLLMTAPINTAIDFTLRIALPQLELGNGATSPIITTGSAAARDADVWTVSGANFSSWFNPSQGTLYCDYTPGNPLFHGVFGFDDGTANERMRLGHSGGSGMATVIVDNNVVQANLTTPANSAVIGSRVRAASVYDTNYSNVWSNGAVSVAPDTSVTLPAVTRVTLGSAQSVNPCNGPIHRLAYLPVRLSDAAALALTQ